MQAAIRVIGGGSIGGKASGFWKARQTVSSEKVKLAHPDFGRIVYFPRTICVATDLFDQFIINNKLSDLIKECLLGSEGAFQKFEQAVMSGRLSDEIMEEFAEVLDTMNYPLAVRSSSVLEDCTGTSFAGKYATIFITNKGSRGERWENLATAIKTVYASICHPNAIEYRRKHGFLDQEEKMAVMIQRAVGHEYKGYYFPLLAGVGFSQSGYCWHEEVKKEDGLVRLVFGLGTRAVGRGYARLFSPGHPTSRPEGYEAQEVEKYSQATMDVLDINANRLKSINFREVIKNGFDCYPGSESLISLRDGQVIYVPPAKLWKQGDRPVLTFDAILSGVWSGINFPKLMGDVMKVLEDGFGCPIDMEFACEMEGEEFRLNILQARPLTQREEQNPEEFPDVEHKDILLASDRDVPTASVCDIEYVVYVDPDGYFSCPLDERYTVARVIGSLNRVLAGKKFILIGPGRWGSCKMELGVPATYAEICHTAMLVEVAVGRYAPEVSFGTHFFQDLIEDGIAYMPVFPEDKGAIFNETFFKKKHSVFDSFLTDPHDRWFNRFVRVIHIPTVSGGRHAHAVLNGAIEKGMVYLK